MVTMLLISQTSMTIFVWIDMVVNATCIVLMYATYDKQYDMFTRENPVGARNCVVAGQAAFRYSPMRPWQRVDLMTRRGTT